MTDGSDSHARLAELVASLSLATDLRMGQPMEQALRTCLLAVATGRELALDDRVLSDVYYLALLRFVGCTSDAHEQAALVGGDEIAFRAGLAPVLMGDKSEFVGYMVRHFAPNRPRLTRLRLTARVMADGTRGAKRSIATHCEIARVLSARIDLPDTVGAYVGHVFERWDGEGLPGGLSGEAIPVAARIVAAARDVDLFYHLGGWALAADVLHRRREKAYDPAVVDSFLMYGERWIADAARGAILEAVLDAEPSPKIKVDERQLDQVLRAFADFADLKSPWTLGHSVGVAELAEAAARGAGLSVRETTMVRRAGLVHDLGRTSIPNGIWDKPGALSRGEWERVRLHPYFSERILSSSALAALAPLAGAHHERLDGSGYHRGSSAALLPLAARILAAADAYQAMTQARPHRPAHSPTAATQQLSREVTDGRLDRTAVDAVLAASGQGQLHARRVWPAGLSEREVEVLRLIAGGASYRGVADRLSISPKTAEHHVVHIYAKIGVSSRAAAALFAMEHDLLPH